MNAGRAFYLRSRRNGYLWSGSAWVATRDAAHPYAALDEAMAQARMLLPVDMVVEFAGNAGEIVIPLGTARRPMEAVS